MLFDLGLDRLAPTHDLNAAQMAALARGAGAERIEAVAYQHLPVFHTEHCVFCRFLSTGTSYRGLRPALREAPRRAAGLGGRPHPVMADVGCRNTVFGAEAQEASLHLEAWLAAGIRHFRLEFVHETADDVERIARAFSLALEGRCAMDVLAAKLREFAPAGTTEGSLFVPVEALTGPR